MNQQNSADKDQRARAASSDAGSLLERDTSAQRQGVGAIGLPKGLQIVKDSYTIKALLVGADDHDCLIADDLFAGIGGVSFELERGTDYEAALAALQSNAYDICFVANRIGERTGVEFARAALMKGLNVPILMLTNSSDRAADFEAMRSGVFDCLPKERLDADGLERAIRCALKCVRAQKELRHTEEKFRDFFNNAAIGIYQSAPDGTLLTVNPTLARILGYDSADQLLGLNLTSIYRNPAERDALIAEHEAHGSASDLEAVWKKRDGSPVWVQLNISAIKGEDGRILYFDGFARDMTERQEVERALRLSDERYRDLFENANDLIYTHDLEGKFTSLNKAGERIIGYARAEALKLDISQIVVPEQLEWSRQMTTRKLEQDSLPTFYELEIIAKDGRRVLLELSTRLIYEDGKPVGVQGIGRDVTERRHLEEQLRQSQKMEAVGRLAGGVAHDFNNLLTAITGYSDLLLRRLDKNNVMRHQVEEIKKAGERAAGLTRQLLAFSRKQVLQPKALDLNGVIADIYRMLGRLIGEDVDLVTTLDPALGKVLADPGQIEQVIVNLVVNARDAMPAGGKITIETGMVELDEVYASKHVCVKPGRYAMIAVSDNGSGMDAATQSHIFEPFFTTKEPGKGTGLGLSTVYGIIKQSGGNVWVYSEVGQGTSFKIYLPCVEQEAPVRHQSAAPSDAPYGTETVLLVEDDEAVRSMSREILEMNGYQVLEAASGAEAVTICRLYKGHIELLLTDVIMPRMSGRELAEQLSSLRPSLRPLYMSGYTDDAIVHHGVLDAGTDFLEKPFTPDALARKVREVLDRVMA